MVTAIEAKNDNAVHPIGTPDSGRLNRVEIDEFVADNDVTNLFLLALAEMQVEDPKLTGKNQDWWTFYSLSGIHGAPNENWNGIGNDNTGYCTHGQFVFPSWHRVYINMFEQALYCKMVEKANEFEDETLKKRYLAAAERFRLPFWDPLMPRYKVENSGTKRTLDQRIWGLPQILAAETVHVMKAPNGDRDDQFPNPLYAFKIPDGNLLTKKGRTKQINLRYGRRPVHNNLRFSTLRSPIDGITRLDLLEAKIQGQGQNLGDKMWKLLGRYSDTKDVGLSIDNTKRSWETFSCHNYVDAATNLVQEHAKDDPSGRFRKGDARPDTDNPNIPPNSDLETAVSLESWHDSIHGLIGAGNDDWWLGNMTNPSIAAFDPIFWLHHCNIDRLFAIYQALNPGSYVTEHKLTKQDKYGFLEKDLKPFVYPGRTPKQNQAYGFYNSDDVRDWRGLGFAVPGNKDLDDEGINGVATYLNKWYSWIARNEPPPEAVTKKWPQDMSKSYALTGNENISPAPVQIDALTSSGLAIMSAAPDETDSPELLTLSVEPSSFQVSDDLAAGLPTEAVGLEKKTTLTYTATVHVKKFAFDGTFFVHLFIDDDENLDNNANDFFELEDEVGFTGVFASEAERPCDSCIQQREAGLIYEDAIPLSTNLYKFLRSNTSEVGPRRELRQLESLNPTHVAPFLEKYLHWKVVTVNDGLIRDDAQIQESGLEIIVSSRVYVLPTAENPLGTYLPSADIPSITEGRVGGAPPGIAALSIQDLPSI